MSARSALLALVALAVVLRLIALDNALWLDEIATWQTYGPMRPEDVLGSYAGSNNHLLNTLLMKACVAVFGESSWTLRLPAFVFGVAAVPALYLCARQALSERASLAAAAMLTVAYPHVFFSQNARGYTAWLTFSLLSAAFLSQAVRGGSQRPWWLWVVTTVGNLGALLLSAFVGVGHVLAGAVAVARAQREGRAALIRRLAIAFGLAGIGGLLLYVWVIPDVLAYMDAEYRRADVGFSLLSAEFAAEVGRGLSVGAGAALLVAAPFGAALGWFGLRALFAERPILTLALFLGPGVQLLVVAGAGLSVVPRHFLLLLPLGLLVVAAGVEAVGVRLRRPGASLVALVLVFSALSALQLRAYYAHPKQDIPGALVWLARHRAPTERVIALHLAEVPIDYYGPQYGFDRGRGTFFVRTTGALDAALADPGYRPGWLVMTLPRALDIGLPELAARVRTDWELVRTFPGTLGDADVTVWAERSRDR